MNTAIYDKTDKGRHEIATRSEHLAPRLRTLLLLIDGRRSEQELLANVAGLGLTEAALAELLAQQYIVLSRSYAALPAVDDIAPIVTAPALAPAVAGTLQATIAIDPVEQFQSVYNFYTKTIKSTIGLRGFTLQMKVEKAATIGDLRELRQPYLDAVLKAKGDAVAGDLRAQLDALLDDENSAANA
jgi:hypothetical protein